ncbi:MAG: zinc ABC transporter substrate-binding protein [Chloroflexi bacterium]|nr:zinc ABC transporter substrate-binding protein [Chloroflexota bacterium]
MNQTRNLLGKFIFIGFILLAACQANVDPTPQSNGETLEESGPEVLAVLSFLADIAQSVAGERFDVEVLIPPGSDPHTFQPTPQDVTKIANSQLLIANGAGLEEWLQEILDNTGGERLVIEAAEGLSGNLSRPGDPHFWLDPIYVIHYAEEIRDGYIIVDPAGEAVYIQNTADYILQLKELDSWIAGQVEQIPSERRMLVTNHESFGYFADRYGFKIIGTIIPSVSTGSSPSAQQLVQLVEEIKKTGIPAIFLEAGTNPELAEQVAREAGVKVVKDLLTHSVSPPGGYIDMMKYNTLAIVKALK